MRAIIIATVIALLPTQAIAADHFDLICRGRVTYGLLDGSQKFATRYRIDLTTKRWCRDDCGRVLPLVSVDEARITFHSIHDDDDVGEVDHFVERAS
ncbi:MAG: hypothetical protein CL949_03065, partial [Erythrobacter sp.]|nr:hypothetical protein [Erythrobacter sp.]